MSEGGTLFVSRLWRRRLRAVGVINLLGPRIPSQSRYWNEYFTFVQLRYEFRRGDNGAPLTIGRTFLSFCTCVMHTLPTRGDPRLPPSVRFYSHRKA